MCVVGEAGEQSGEREYLTGGGNYRQVGRTAGATAGEEQVSRTAGEDASRKTIKAVGYDNPCRFPKLVHQ